MRIKKFAALLLAGLMCTGLFSGCGTKDNNKIKIGVIQIVQHLSLNTIRDSFTAQMEELGYVDGENCMIEYKDAQGDPTMANTIIQSFEASGMDLIVAIATPTAQAAATVSDKIPVVFSAVTDPVAAGLADSLESTGKNITGTSDALQIDQMLDFALTLTPGIKKLGYIYNAGEDNSVSCLAQVKAYCSENGIEVVESAVTNSSEVKQAAEILVSKTDAVFTPNDNTVATAMAALSSVAKKAKIPLYVGADSMVMDGGFATVGINYEDLGKETANMADLILKGEKKPSEIPVKVFNTNLYQYINEDVAKEIGVEIPQAVLDDEKTVMVTAENTEE